MRRRVTELLRLLGSQGAQREGVNFLAHTLAQRIINHLMLLDEGKPNKGRGNHQRLEMDAVVSQNLDEGVGKLLLNE